MLKVAPVFYPPCPFHKPFTAISPSFQKTGKNVGLFILFLRTVESSIWSNSFRFTLTRKEVIVSSVVRYTRNQSILELLN